MVTVTSSFNRYTADQIHSKRFDHFPHEHLHQRIHAYRNTLLDSLAVRWYGDIAAGEAREATEATLDYRFSWFETNPPSIGYYQGLMEEAQERAAFEWL